MDTKPDPVPVGGRSSAEIAARGGTSVPDAPLACGTRTTIGKRFRISLH